MKWLKKKSGAELQKLWCCNEKIAEENVQRLADMDLTGNLTPAILSYDGIAYTYMAPVVFEDTHYDYVQENLRILSAFYGVIKPMDGIVPYRLEMQAKAAISGYKNLYDYWGDSLYKEIRDESGLFINLASKEYSKCIEKYLTRDDTFITCIFAELKDGKLLQNGVHVKMARGEMVRFMAEYDIHDPEKLKDFDRLHYHFSKEHSSENTFVFLH